MDVKDPHQSANDQQFNTEVFPVVGDRLEGIVALD